MVLCSANKLCNTLKGLQAKSRNVRQVTLAMADATDVRQVEKRYGYPKRVERIVVHQLPTNQLKRGLLMKKASK